MAARSPYFATEESFRGIRHGESPAAALRRILATPGAHQAPCCYDALAARLVEQAGFPIAFMSGIIKLIVMTDLNLNRIQLCTRHYKLIELVMLTYHPVLSTHACYCGSADVQSAGVSKHWILFSHVDFNLFPAGFCVSAAKLGLPDVGLISYGEMVEQARLITEAVSIPVVGDGDNGYGNSMNIKRTIKGYINAGLAAIMLEDQVCVCVLSRFGIIIIMYPSVHWHLIS
jgi:2-methylisocitrate lyase-like PEP mutase family enzyme